MTLDDDITWREQARRDKEHDDARARAEWEERELTESIEAEESKWRGIFAADPYSEVHYAEPSWLDRSARGPHDG